MQEVDVLVVGGGSTGCSVLYHLAKAGVRSCLLVDMAPQLAAGQTSRSTALIRTHYSTEILTRMALSSYRFFKNFGEELPGRTSGFVETGLLVGADEASVKPLRENVAMHRSLGIDSRVMTPDELADSRIEPELDAKAFAAVAYEPNSGYAEPSATATSFASVAEGLGARVLTGALVTGVERVHSSRRSLYSVTTTAGAVSCGKMVLATGVWSKPLFAKMGVALPLTVARHPVAMFGRPTGYRGTRPSVFDFPRSAYYKPEGNDSLFVGSLARELDASGKDVDPDAYDRGITYDEVSGFSESVATAIPSMASGGAYRRGYAGLYDNTPDQHPIIDELSDAGFPGVYCVVGLSGHGFKLAPEFGRIIASLVSEGRFEDYDISVFKLRRFDDGRLLRGRYGVSTVL